MPAIALRLCLALLLCGAAAPAAAAPPARIVSLNLCADQLVLALADRSQIAALTRFVKDPSMSAAAAEARDAPVSDSSAEAVLALRPDLVVANPGFAMGRIAALTSGRYRVVELPAAESHAEIIANIRTVAAAVGHPARGEAMIRRMGAELAAIPVLKGGGVAAYYQRRGFLSGTGTLIDELMRRVGLRNLASVLGKGPLSRLSIEELVASRPDYLIVESDSEQVVDHGTEMLRHPALAAIPRLRLSQAWTVCGGPAYVRAARSLAAQMRQAHPGGGRH
ncbi:ABC transporter substrate-binding protein [Sphingomonas flavalba]|uniref:ABC transporter substrate-binding protein n=1 Tax=Sphingomonas flavalba TaxID=2559804 RepID=UPI0039E17C67